MRLKLAVLLLLPYACISLGPPGARGGELDELLSGFGETEDDNRTEIEELLGGFVEQASGEPEENAPSATPLPSWLDLYGSLAVRTAVNFAEPAPPPGTPDYRGLSMLRGRGEVIGDVSFDNWKGSIAGIGFYDVAYYLNGQRDLYTDDYLNEYEWELEIGEAYLQGILSERLDLKIGRQIVGWGRSDNIRVTDVLNPLDLRWPGMTDIRYLKLPVTMTRLDYYVGDWSSSLIIVNEPRFAKTPVYNGEFYPGSQPLPELRKPDWSWENQQPAVSINGIFSGWDISFYAARVYPEFSHLEKDESGTLYRTYDKAWFTGTAANIALGNWLLKAEAAYWDGLRYTQNREGRSRIDILAGAEYSGFSETMLAFEIVTRHIFDYDLQPAGQSSVPKEDVTQYSARFLRDFVHDTLHLAVVLTSYGFLAEDGGFERIQLDYDLNDRVMLTGGVIFYESGGTPGFSGVGDNDMVFAEVKYSF